MMVSAFTYFIYGMSVMFYFMMAWVFWRKGSDTLSRLTMGLMMVQGTECLKDMYFFGFTANTEWHWYMMTAVDVVVIPVYVSVLMELCRPGWFSIKKLLVHELPFAVLLILLLLARSYKLYFVLLAWSGVYGTATLALVFVFIAQYNRQLKERFSYEDNINLNWLRGILMSFWCILLIWIVCSFTTDGISDNVYNVGSLILWMVISYFVYKHEYVIAELENIGVANADGALTLGQESKEYQISPEFIVKVKRLFEEEQLYLEPHLKLSDVADRVGTNRTYISRYFNRGNGQTFYDYVNSLRVKHAENLLLTSSHPLFLVAEEAGFNSLSTFRRVFMACHDCTPAEFRNRAKSRKR